jgi:hypothetical protein
MMKNLFTNVSVLLFFAIGFTSCTEEISEEIQNEEKLASSGVSTAADTGTLTMSVTNEISSQYSHFLHEKNSDDEGCELKIVNAGNIESSDYSYADADLNTDCILDAGEFDLFYQGAELKINVDAGLCENIEYRPFKFFQYQPGNTKKVLYKVKCDAICAASENTEIMQFCDQSENVYDDLGTVGTIQVIDGAPQTYAANFPVLNTVASDKTDDLCKFDHSQTNSVSPNCDEGSVTIKNYTLTGNEEDAASTGGNGCSVTDRTTNADCTTLGTWTSISCELPDISVEATCNAATTWSPGSCNLAGLLVDDTEITQTQCNTVVGVREWVIGYCDNDSAVLNSGACTGQWNNYGICSDTNWVTETSCIANAGAGQWTATRLTDEDLNSSVIVPHCSILPGILTDELSCTMLGTWSNSSCSDATITDEDACSVARTWNPAAGGQCFTTSEVSSTQCASYNMGATPVYVAASCDIGTRTSQGDCETAGTWAAPNTCGDFAGAQPAVFITDTEEDVSSDCGGSHTSCFAGPLGDLENTRDQWVKYQIDKGESHSKTHTIPSPNSEGYVSNMSIVNYSRVCSEIGSTKDAAYWLGGPNHDTAEVEEHNILNPYTTSTIDEYEILAESAIKGSFNYYGAGSDYGESLVVSGASTTPYYSFRCIDHAGDVKAQIRIFIREWDRSFIDETQTNFDFSSVSDIWLSANSRYMDSYNATNSPTNEWNDVYDWDDFWKDQSPGNEIFTDNSCNLLNSDPNPLRVPAAGITHDYLCSVVPATNTTKPLCLGASGDWTYEPNSRANFPGLAL